MNILVLGIGQPLCGDDSAGLEAVRIWRARYPQSARQVQVETNEMPGLDLLDLLDGVDAAVIVDTVQAKAPAGALMRLGLEDLATFRSAQGSTHGWGLAETLRLGAALAPRTVKCQLTLIGIAGSQFDVGASVSPPVRKALPQAAEMIESVINGWLITTNL